MSILFRSLWVLCSSYCYCSPSQRTVGLLLRVSLVSYSEQSRFLTQETIGLLFRVLWISGFQSIVVLLLRVPLVSYPGHCGSLAQDIVNLFSEHSGSPARGPVGLLFRTLCVSCSGHCGSLIQDTVGLLLRILLVSYSVHCLSCSGYRGSLRDGTCVNSWLNGQYVRLWTILYKLLLLDRDCFPLYNKILDQMLTVKIEAFFVKGTVRQHF